MKSLLACAIAFLLLHAGPSARAKPGWTDDRQQALAKARSEKKLVLMYFTGSDWCSWCLKMDKEVFDTPEFKAFAAQNLVLVELDFPAKKSIPLQTMVQNEMLQRLYGVETFPTLIVLNEDGKVLKIFDGYQRDGAKAFVAELGKLRR